MGHKNGIILPKRHISFAYMTSLSCRKNAIFFTW